jgi:hypothetical protein
MSRKKKSAEGRTIAVVDAETDPFLFGRVPKPFCWGFYDGKIYKEFWGDKLSDCTEQLLDYIRSRPDPLLIYAHNGGKFDFFFFMEHGALENPALIINGRVVKCQFLGVHEIRDSYAILPVPLKKLASSAHGSKLDIEYEKMEADVRHLHREEISTYLKQDCLVLHDYVAKFRERFGDKVTVGSAAITELEKHHPVSRQNTSHDIQFRPFYFGGRVECFEGGKLVAPPGQKWKIFDVNSMYPKAMHSFDHPTGARYVALKGDSVKKIFDPKTGNIKGFSGMYFMRFVGHNKNALPYRNPDTGIMGFDLEYGEFHACSHEIKAACELGLLRVDDILDVYIPCNFQRFEDFVEHFAAEKAEAKKNGDSAGETFAKLMLNSAYGKFGSNANEFKEWFIYDDLASDDEKRKFEEWRDQHPLIRGGKSESVISRGAEMVHDYGRFEIWQAPNPSDRGFFDVAVAASITSAARSMLLRAIQSATRPVYCDTDSLTCLDLGLGVEIDEYRLGAWKFEGSTDIIYIAGKKMYSCELDQRGKDGSVKHKTASKGAHLGHADIIKLCAGEVVEWRSDAPNFKFSGDTKFVARKIRKNI